MDSNNDLSFWVDSGIEISSSQSMPISVNGSINECQVPGDMTGQCTDRTTCTVTKVSSVSCEGYSPYDLGTFSVSSPNETLGVYPPSRFCSSAGYKSFIGGYIESYLPVLAGDTIIVDLVPAYSYIVNNCSNFSADVSFYTNSRCELRDSGGNCLSNDEIKKICQQGGIVFDDNGLKYDLSKFEGNEYNGFTGWYARPEDNLLHRGTSSSLWVHSAKLDLRITEGRKEYNTECNNSNINIFNVYDVNYRCGNLCNDDNCSNKANFYSIIYDWQGSGQTRQPALNPDTGQWTRWIPNISALVSNSHYNSNSRGYMCITSGQTSDTGRSGCSSSPLYLSTKYIVGDNLDIPNNATLRYAILSPLEMHGGYNIESRRYCLRSQGKHLYMYVAQPDPNTGMTQAPNFVIEEGKPLPPNVYSLESEMIENSSGIYVLKSIVLNSPGSQDINGKSLEGLSGRLFFSISNPKDNITYKRFSSIKDVNFEELQDNRYDITFSISYPVTIISDTVNFIYDRIMELFYGDLYSDSSQFVRDGIIIKIYLNIVKKLSGFLDVILILYISGLGFMFLAGLSQNSKFDLISRLVKVIIVIILVSDRSWDIFGTQIISFFIFGVQELIAIFSDSILEVDTSFAFADSTLGLLADGNTWLRLLSITFSGLTGFVISGFVLWGVLKFLSFSIEVILKYFMIMIGMAILLALAPIFIMFVLFQVTRSMFDGWLKLIVSFALQPLFLLTMCAVVTQVIQWSLFSILGYDACASCSLYLPLGDQSVEDPIRLCLVKVFYPVTFHPDYDVISLSRQMEAGDSGLMGLPVEMTVVILFVCFVKSFGAFTTFMDNIVTAISGSMLNMGGGGAGSAAGSASEALKSLIGQDQGTQQTIRRALLRHDKNTSINLDTDLGSTPGRRPGSRTITQKDDAENKKPDTATAPTRSSINKSAQDDMRSIHDNQQSIESSGNGSSSDQDISESVAGGSQQGITGSVAGGAQQGITGSVGRSSSGDHTLDDVAGAGLSSGEDGSDETVARNNTDEYSEIAGLREEDTNFVDTTEEDLFRYDSFVDHGSVEEESVGTLDEYGDSNVDQDSSDQQQRQSIDQYDAEYSQDSSDQQQRQSIDQYDAEYSQDSSDQQQRQSIDQRDSEYDQDSGGKDG
ncbi:MAG: trbL/VirB6 plasmid conjugal transfer family protein [Candidatus Xenolissoclinum pacificiensis L6]|uniref:TrbL/VirB6 plasmid conjugal transfer family protein n=1 Tax=Candidatus Xenolissoclinum pacificiensis L6 TaxID=1401685 RepID=W2V2A4_9RICK|nr:MAG: trbL/VirB6 plasmid conjugal transfer family protein [Candidatus Xenolissoclinum pacificiensis L6]